MGGARLPPYPLDPERARQAFEAMMKGAQQEAIAHVIGLAFVVLTLLVLCVRYWLGW